MNKILQKYKVRGNCQALAPNPKAPNPKAQNQMAQTQKAQNQKGP